MSKYDLDTSNYIKLELNPSPYGDYIIYSDFDGSFSNGNYHCVHKDYDKIILLIYPFGSGGNFLINCLFSKNSFILMSYSIYSIFY